MGEGPEVCLVVPTLREANSLRILGPRIAEALHGLRADVLIVDDDSRDGTEAVVAELARTAPFRLFVRRGERGLASAVLAGFERTTAPIIAVMDADGNHPPELLPALLEPIRRGIAEFTLASRNVPGGYSGTMRRVRRGISGGAALLARPLTTVRDPMSGYFALRRSILARAALDPVGYKIALEILVKCRPDPVLEVPFRFGVRVAGESKLGANVIGAYVKHLGRLYGYRISRFGRASTTR